MTAFMVAFIELVGGFLFTFGIFSRLTSVVLFVNMTMAYLSVPDDRTNFFHILSNPSDFYGATPYTYWFAALLILVFGPGLFAVDSVLGHFAKRKPITIDGRFKHRLPDCRRLRWFRWNVRRNADRLCAHFPWHGGSGEAGCGAGSQDG